MSDQIYSGFVKLLGLSESHGKLVGQGSVSYNQPKPSTIIWEMPQNFPIKFGILLDSRKNGSHLNHPSKLPMDYESVNP